MVSVYPERQGNAADQRLLKALPRNSDGAIAQSGFFVRQYKNSQAVVELLTRIFVKYDGKDASKCAMRGLRGNALNKAPLPLREGELVDTHSSSNAPV